MPFANKLRLATALGSVGFITAGSVMFGVHLQTQDEDMARAAAAQSATELSSCLTYVRNVTGPEPKIIVATTIPEAIQNDCGISKKLENALNADQARGMPAVQPYEAEVIDTSGSTVKLPSETSLKDKITHLEAAAEDDNPAMRIFLGSLSGFTGFYIGMIGVGYTMGRINRVQLKRREIKMKTSDIR